MPDTSGDYSRASAPPCPRPHDGGPRPCTCVQGPKNYVETSTCRCTTTGMSSPLSKNCFCTSGPEHQSGTATGMPTSLSKKSGPVEHHEDELHLRHLHCDAHQNQGICRCTQRARKPCPRAAPVESPRELQRAATVETRPSSPRQHPKNMLILHNRDVEHFVNGLQLDNLYSQLKRQTKGAVSAPRQE